MKHLILFLISFPILACEMSIPLSYYPIFSNPPVSGPYAKCTQSEQCLCIDECDPYYSALVDELNSNGEVIGKKCINDGTKRDAYKAAEKAAEQSEAKKKKDRDDACRAIELTPDETLDSIFGQIDEKLTHKELIQYLNGKYEQQKQHAKNAKRCMR